VKWGLFLVIVPTVGMSADLLFSQPYIAGITSLIFILSMFGGGFIYGRLVRHLGFRPSLQISSTLMLVIKSSAFSAVMALLFFDETAALPSGILSIFVTSYIIVYAFYQKRQKTDRENGNSLKKPNSFNLK
jgi:MFS family permease